MSTSSSTDSVTTEEVWLPVVGFESIYEVSDLGRVRRIVAGRGTRPGTKLGRVLKPWGRGGRSSQYLSVNLSWKDKVSTRLVHILVLTAFRGPAPVDEEYGDYQGHHDNGDTHDNRLCNVFWLLSKENREEQWRRYMETGSVNA